MALQSRKILLTGFYPPPLGGESVHVRTLAQHLTAAGASVQVINARRGAPPSPEYRTISGRLDFVQALLRALGPDTMLHFHTHGHSWISWFMILAAAVALQLRQAVGVLTLHSGLCPGYLAETQSFMRCVIRTAVASFTHIVCVNKEIRSMLESFGVERERLSVIPAFLGVGSVPSLSDLDADTVTRMKPLIVVIGGPQTEYGLPLCVSVLPSLSHDFPSLGCIIIGASGDGPLQASLTDTGLTKHVVCLGQISHDRCLSIVSRADVFVRPSYADGDSVAVREALALGVPVVASDTDFRPEGVILFRRGDAADLAEQIAHALKNGRRANASLQGNGSGSLERLLEIYRRLNGVPTSAGEHS